MLIVKNVKTSEVTNVETKKEVAEFIAKSGATENSVATIVKKLKDAVEKNEILYDTFEVSEDKTEELTTKEMEEHSADQEQSQSELLDDIREQLGDEIADKAEKIVEESKGETETPKEEKQDGRRNRNGKTLIVYKNGTEVERFPTIKKCAEYMKEELDLSHLPFTPIMKSARDGIDYNEWSFKFENETDKYTPSQLKEMNGESEEKDESAPTQESETSETENEAEQKWEEI